MTLQRRTAREQSAEFDQFHELNEIRGRIERLLESFRATDNHEMIFGTEVTSRTTERSVREVLRARANRGRFFRSDLFADPAWDILLELYAAYLGQLRISVSSLCIAAAVPATTALRWISTLQDDGLVDREDDHQDGRRSFVFLTEKGIAGMDHFFGSIAVHRHSNVLDAI
jgi:hypothetical protein